MKKLVSIFLSAVIICGLLLISACDRTEDVRKSDGKISVVTTIFPYYDFVRQLAGDKVDIRLLLSPGSDPHSYEPKPSDITAIENCDIFICNGGESDEWVDGVLSSIENKDVKVMKMMEYVIYRKQDTNWLRQEPWQDEKHQVIPNFIQGIAVFNFIPQSTPRQTKKLQSTALKNICPSGILSLFPMNPAK